jgi:hypothetical protein
MSFATRSTWRARAPTFGGLTQDDSCIVDAKGDDAAVFLMGHSASAVNRDGKADDDGRVGLNSGGNLGPGANEPGRGEIGGGNVQSSIALSGRVAGCCEPRLEGVKNEDESDKKREHKYTAIELCAGASGMALAARNRGFEHVLGGRAHARWRR